MKYTLRQQQLQFGRTFCRLVSTPQKLFRLRCVAHQVLFLASACRPEATFRELLCQLHGFFTFETASRCNGTKLEKRKLRLQKYVLRVVLTHIDAFSHHCH